MREPEADEGLGISLIPKSCKTQLLAWQSSQMRELGQLCPPVDVPQSKSKYSVIEPREFSNSHRYDAAKSPLKPPPSTERILKVLELA